MLEGMTTPSYAHLLRELRGRRTQAEVAALAGIHQSTVSRAEAGRVPDLTSGYRLVRLLGATVEQLDAALGVPTDPRRVGS